ncbi:MAG: acyl carrier protein [Candidatus Omnitrophica bacterium]|nr:acyl carrier protein [Candidatus Omnitrophota bacterium]
MPEEMLDKLKQELIELVANVTGRDTKELKPDANFWKDLGVDSIKAIEISVAIERKFKVSIRDEQIPQITTIAEALKVLKEALEKKNKV